MAFASLDHFCTGKRLKMNAITKLFNAFTVKRVAAQLLSEFYFCIVHPTSNVYSPSHILADVEFYFAVTV